MKSPFTLIAIIALSTGLLSAADRPNILLIFADDVGTDVIGAYGGESYPTLHIDALAAGGAKFTHGYAMPVCHPSRISLMTGKYPTRFGKAGMKWGDYPDAAEGHSIGDRMRAAGYATAVAGKWQLCFMRDDLKQPERTGFDEWALFGWHEGGRFNDPFIYQNGELRNDTSGEFGPDLYVEFLVDFMERSNDEGKPFFAYYSMALCHDVTDDLKDEHVAFYKDGRWMNYAEMAAAMDDMVGRLIFHLNRMGIREDTLVIFTTDNGTAGKSYLTVDGNGKMVRPKVVSVQNGEIVPGGKGKLDDTGTRVPFIANWPGTIEPGRIINEMVDLTDLLPTFEELAGAEPDGVRRDGISFAPLLLGRNRERQRPWVFIEHRGKKAIRSPDWKLYGDGRFFDMQADPKEKRPLKKSGIDGEALEEFIELEKAINGINEESTGSGQ
ncbi:MAG: sulfatase-like hydrolase/transferase [Verrucomicrobiales bacterium]|nr:sulfatase-like hydrolase/transferase [Verrucomicrobiales bacterium]